MNSIQKQIPMWLTYSRILLLPLILILISLGSPTYCLLATALFWLGAFTDYLDGKLARRFNAVTSLGKFMDPIADKILVSGVLIYLIPFGKLSPILVIILISRDILIDGVRAAAALDKFVIAAKPFGKWKTAIQMTAIPLLFFDVSLHDYSLSSIGISALWFSVLLSIISGFEYIIGYRKNLKGG